MGRKLLVVAAVIAVGMVLNGGCKSSGGSGGVDLQKTVDQIKAEVEKMDVEQIKAAAMKYKKAIDVKSGEVGALVEKIKAVPATEMLTDEYKGLKGEVDELNKSLKLLKDRLDVYVGKLKELKADVSGLAV